MGFERATKATLATVLLAVAGACGGGGSDTEGGGDPNDPGAMSIEARVASTNRVGAKLEEFVAAKNAKPFEALRDWALTQPEFADAGVGDRSFWGKFKDGRYFLYTDNRDAVKLPLPPVQPEPTLSTGAGLRALAANASEVPEENRALLLAFLGDGEEFAHGKAVEVEIRKLLVDRGWKVDPVAVLTPDALKRPDRLGLLYMTSHSGLFGPTGHKDFAVMTETQATFESEAKYKADLDAGRLIWHRDRSNFNKLGFGNQPRYSITQKFVEEYMRFAKNSLVVLMSCETGTPDAAGFRGALTTKGAGTIIAWNGLSNTAGNISMHYMFDRLTGANKVDPPSPPNRAFDLDEVWTFLGKKTLATVSTKAYPLLITPGLEGKPDVEILRFGDGFKISNPVVTDLEASWKDRLVIHGQFGKEKGSVTVGGTAVAVDKWTNDSIEVLLPTAKNDPPGSRGEVVVTARERTSNRRVLASWRGLVEYTYEMLPNDTGTGLLSNRITLDLHVRGDAHETRSEVDGPLKRSKALVVPASDTDAKYIAEGSNTNGVTTRSWSGGGPLPFTADGDKAPSLSALGTIDAITNELKFFPTLTNSLTMITVTTNGVSRPAPMNWRNDTLGFKAPYGGDALAQGTAFSLNGEHNVAPYDRRIRAEPLNGSSEWMRVKTNGLYIGAAFDEKIGR